jgi:glycosyltransferase involved in cell wall biosynthesis
MTRAGPTTPGAVVADLRAIQSPDHRGRGIGRWAYELATGLERVRPDLVGAYLLDPEWPPPGSIDELLSTGKLAYIGSPSSDAAIAQASAYLCCSPYELSKPIQAVRPPFVDARGLAYCAVAYDLIPLRHPEEYLLHPAQRRRYRARLEVLRCADALLAISHRAAEDLGRYLGVGAGRCHVVGTGVSRHFVPPASRRESLRALSAEMPGLEGPFVLYPGGNDGRKNIEELIFAFAELPPRLLGGLQLVVVGDLPPLTANHYRHLARQAGVEAHLLLTGFVSDDRLTRLYQSADLFVFPSIAEGYGLPVAEALACGAVAAVSDRSPFDRLVPEPKARFDPLDRTDMAATMERCLVDEGLRATVRAAALTVVVSWDDVAARAASVLDGLVLHRRAPWRERRRLAVISPFPPAPSGVADYSAKLVEALHAVASRRFGPGAPPLEVDCFADGAEHTPAPLEPVAGTVPRLSRRFETVDGAVGSYDRVLYVLGNSEFHAEALALLRRRKGVVLSHDVRLSGLMSLAGPTRGAVAGGLKETIARAYSHLPARLGEGRTITPDDRDRYGLLLLRDVLMHTDQLFVTSQAAKRLADLDAGPALEDRVRVLPFAIARLTRSEREQVAAARATRRRRLCPRRARISSFGIVDAGKRLGALVEAVARVVASGADAELAIVGPSNEQLTGELVDLARALGIGERLSVTGRVEREEYLRLLGETDVAVQMRLRFFGEASSAVSECLSAAVPTIVSDLGWMRELPGSVVRKVPHECSAAVLADAIAGLLDDRDGAHELAAAGEAYAGEHTFERCAEALLGELGW